MWQEHIAALPCLNCEGEPIIADVKGAGFRLVCPDCGCRGRFHSTENEAIDAWNGGPEHREAIEKIQRERGRSFVAIF